MPSGLAIFSRYQGPIWRYSVPPMYSLKLVWVLARVGHADRAGEVRIRHRAGGLEAGLRHARGAGVQIDFYVGPCRSRACRSPCSARTGLAWLTCPIMPLTSRRISGIARAVALVRGHAAILLEDVVLAALPHHVGGGAAVDLGRHAGAGRERRHAHVEVAVFLCGALRPDQLAPSAGTSGPSRTRAPCPAPGRDTCAPPPAYRPCAARWPGSSPPARPR